MAEQKDREEPSMEEILSSIRRIIADEQDEPGARPVAAAPPASPAGTAPAGGVAAATAAVGPDAAEPEEDELELTELVAGPPARPEPPPRAPMTAPAARQPQPPERPIMPPQDDASLVSSTTAQASTSALARLTRAVASEERPLPGGGRTIEDLVIELLRPQLKEWLDNNLAPLVERVVEQEVKKLARRAELL